MNLANQIRFETDCPGDTIHLHNEMELFYTLQGRCAVFADQQNYVLKPEDFAVFNPFSSHQLYREEGAHTLSLYIPIHLLNQAGVGPYTATIADSTTISRIIPNSFKGIVQVSPHL